VSTDPSAEISAALAEVRRLLGPDPAQAEARARDILRENPDEPDALLLLAIALRRKGATTSARAILEQLAQNQSHRPQVHYELGLVLGMVGDNRGATQSLKYAVDLDPGFGEVTVRGDMAAGMGLLLHEMATNAAKYGALSNDTGTVALDWEVLEESDGRKLRMIWTEAGGPHVTAPVQRGFGSRLIERSARDQLGGEATVDFLPRGVVYTVTCALEDVS